MQNVADNRDFQSINPAFVFANRKRIEQRLCRMLVRAVAGVNDRGVGHARKMKRRARHRVTNHDAIGRHRFEISRRVQQRFAFGYARG